MLCFSLRRSLSASFHVSAVEMGREVNPVADGIELINRLGRMTLLQIALPVKGDETVML